MRAGGKHPPSDLHALKKPSPCRVNLRNEIYGSTYNNLFRNVDGKVLLKLAVPIKLK